MQIRTLWLLAQRTAQSYSSHGCSQLAAAISYYVLFSVVPLLIFLTSVFGFVATNHSVRQRVIDRVVTSTPLEPEQGESLVSDTVRGVSRASFALSAVGIVAMAWSASAMVGAARRALNTVWSVPGQRPVVQAKLVDLAAVAGIGLLLAASIAATTGLHVLRQVSSRELGILSDGQSFLWLLLFSLLPPLVTMVVFVLLYRYIPNADIRVGDVWPGALLATVLFEVLKNGFTVYVTHFNNYNVVYGSLGAVMIFLMWTYLASSFMLLGAEFAVQTTRLRRGELAGEVGRPGTPPGVAVRRFVRGLFVRE